MSNLPRSRVEQPFQGYPVYGAVHEILPDHRFREFLTNFAKISDSVIASELQRSSIIDPNPERLADEDYDPIVLGESTFEAYKPKNYYRIFDADDMAVPVIEMRNTQRAARAIHTVFEGQDFGAVQQDAQNEMDRRQPLILPKLTFVRVQGVGKLLPHSTRVDNVRQTLALVADPLLDPEVNDVLDHEHLIIMNQLARRLKQFAVPSSFMKIISFAALKNTVSKESIQAIIQELNVMLSLEPLHVEIERQLIFRFKAIRSRK